MNINHLLTDVLVETGAQISVSVEEARTLIATEAAKLALVTGEPGFNMVLRASRDVVALKLGVSASQAASTADSRIVGIIQALLLGAV